MRPYATIAATLVLVACANPSVPLASRQVDDTFRKHTLRWSGTFAGSTTTYYLKTFDDQGLLAICGARVASRGGYSEDLTTDWFAQAHIVLARPANRIASARFINVVPADAGKDQMSANCVRTTTPAAGNLDKPATVVGSAITVVY